MDLVDELDVLIHDVKVFFFVNLAFSLESPLQRVKRIFKVPLLVVVFLLDFRIHIRALGLLVLDVLH